MVLQTDDYNAFQNAIEILLKLEEKKGAQLREELKSLPKGSLYVKFVEGKPYFTWSVSGERRPITRDLDLVYKLARKMYIELKLKEHEHEIARRKSSSLIRVRPLSTRIRKLLEKYNKARLDLIRITLSPEQYRWMKSRYPCYGRTKKHIYRTYSGIYMRSKSERDIGNEMELEGIPYHYEEEIEVDVSWIEGAFGDTLGDKNTYYPDFIILTTTGKKIYWEHLGYLFRFDYREHNMEKLAALRQGGYVAEDEFIISVEKDMEDSNFIKNTIARRILPYM